MQLQLKSDAAKAVVRVIRLIAAELGRAIKVSIGAQDHAGKGIITVDGCEAVV